ncbi:FAD-dependent oxidoreductase, partial [Romboutsia ilealis]|uniref:FAD-dependent oxidoreductase n=2 Tax=Romboutsia ilealis TaxID=1115758 RepID=UPI0025B762BA
MKIVVIGCTHAGTAAVVNIKENYPDSEVVIYEKNNNVSFLSCGIALNVGKVIDTTEKLFYSSPKALNSLGAQTKMQHEVLDIDFKNKKLSVKNLLTNEVFEDNYDKLVLTLGSWPIVPKFEGGTLDNIVLCKNYNHALNIIEKSKDAKNVVVIGAGYIGVELAEAFEMQGKNTTLIDAENRIMAKYLDKEFTDIAETEFKNKGVNIVLGQKVQKFEGTDTVKKVITDKGEYNADLVVLCIGFAPNTKLVQGKLETLPNGAIIIDEYMR